MACLVFCEDEPSIRRLIEAALRTSRHDIYIADDGEAGLELIERLRPDAVFVDLRMPGLDGYRLHDAIRARPHLNRVPIAVVTASTQRDELEKIRARGVAAVLLKPFSPAALRAAVDQIVRGSDVAPSPACDLLALAYHDDRAGA